MKATCIFMEEEVEYELRLVMDVVKDQLKSMIVPGSNPRIEIWQTPFYDIKVITNFLCLLHWLGCLSKMLNN